MTADDAVHAARLPPLIETCTFETSDGIDITGDLAVADRPIASAVVCHPHPQYGGNRFNNVVEALFTALPAAGITTLRFDFRAEFGGGVSEQLDLSAALDLAASSSPGQPLIAIGYSFGAMVTLAIDRSDLAGKALIAPPLGAIDLEPGSPCPTLVLSPAHDQFAPPSVAEPIVATWTNATFEPIESVDHFIAGRTGLVAERVTDWVTRSTGLT